MRFLPVFFGVFICLAVGFAGSLLQSDALRTWYPFLEKSALTPPGAVFGGVWTVLYIMMGVSIGLVWMRKATDYRGLTGLFALQLAFNFLWSVAFFLFRSPWAGMAAISALLPLIILYAVRCHTHSRLTACLLLPYIFWVAFAWYLNLYVALHN